MLKQSQQQYSFILPTWKNHEKSIKILQISSEKLESEKGMSWTIGSPNGGATGGGPGIGCIGWKGLAEAQFTILPIFGERKIVSSTRCFWDFWKFLLFFFGIFLFEVASFPLCCVPRSFHWFFLTDFSNSLVQFWALGRQPIGRQGIALEIWEAKVSSAHFTERTQAADVEGWLRTGAAHPQFHRGKAVLSIAGLRILSHAYLLRPQQGMVHMFWDLPSRPRRLMAWFAMFSPSSPVLIWMRSEPASCVWPSDILWAYDEFPCSHLCITFLLEGLSVYPVCSIFEESGGQPESSPIKSSTKWPLTKMTSCSNIEVGAQLHTNLRTFIDQSAVRTFRISKETIKVKATFYTVNNHTWHCDILYHHLRMISNACLNWLHLYLLGKTNSICTMCTWIDILEANMIIWLELFKLFM